MACLRVCIRERRLLVGGRGWHVRARPCTEGKGRLARAVGFHRVGTGSTSAARRVHAVSELAAPLPEREHALARSPVRTRELRLLVVGRGWHVGARPCTEREGRLAGAVGLGRSRTDCNQRAAARARRKRAVLCLFPRDSTRWRVRVCAHANAGCTLEAVAGSSEHGHAPREWAVSLAQWALICHVPALTSLRRARTPQARVLRLLPRESTQWSVRAYAHSNAGCSSETAAGTSEHGHAPRHRERGPSRWRGGP